MMRTPNMSRAQAHFADMPADAAQHRAITEALERARVVAVLDGWAVTGRRNVPQVQRALSGPGWSVLVAGAERDYFFEGPTPDAARAAAARAIEAGEV